MSKQKKDLEDLRALGVTELKNKIREAEHDLFTMKFNLSTGQLEKTAKIESTKRIIARMKTIITEKQNKSSITER